MQMTEISEIIETFELLGDWETRYQYLVEIGEQLQAMPMMEKTDANRVKPCMSTVFVNAYRDPDDSNIVRYHGDCDTAIIKGVVALLIGVMTGKSAAQILDLDIDRMFTGLHLQEHLSPARHVGVYAIVEHMRDQASRLLQEAA